MVQTPSVVLVTGACGHVGRKLVEAMARRTWCHRVVGLDVRPRPALLSDAAHGKLTLVPADLADEAGDWRRWFAGVDAVIHLAARNPDVDATWAEAAASFGMTAAVGLAALQAGVRRFVFASSNHVMGGYKDGALADSIGPGLLTTDLDPAPGTRWHDGTRHQDSTAYASAKLMGERFAASLAAGSAGRLSAVSIRIGWIQPGANRPHTISHAGSVLGGVPAAETADARRDLRWFRNMWLADDDAGHLFERAVLADVEPWPAPAIVVNGTSANRGADWDLQGARTWLGYQPRHDLYRELGS